MAYKGGGGIGGPRRKLRRKQRSGAAAHPDPPKVAPRRRAAVRSKGADRHPPPRSTTPAVRRRASGGNVFKRPIGRKELASSDPKVRKRQIVDARRAETARKLRRARDARRAAERPVLGPPAPQRPRVHAHPKSGLAAAQAERDVARLKRTARDRQRPLARRLAAERVLRTRHGVVDQDDYLRRSGVKLPEREAKRLLRDAAFGGKPDAKRKLRRAIRAGTLPNTGQKRTLLKNLERNLDDLVTGAPASVVELAKATGEQVAKLAAPIAGAGGRRGKAKVKTPASDALVESYKKDDILYGLVTKGPKEAGKRAHRNPLSAIGYATGGGGTALRVLNRAHGGTAKARARPRLRRPEDGPPKPTAKGRAGVRQAQAERKAAKRRVQARKQGGTPEAERGKVQHYSRQPLIRGAQKARENVAAARGRDPFELRGRRLEREQRRRAEETAHNEEAGSLEREVQTQRAARRETRRVTRGKRGRAALNLIYAGAIRKGREKADLEAIAATYERRGDKSNAATVRRLLDDLERRGERAAVHRARPAAEKLIAASRDRDRRRVAHGELAPRQAEYRRAIQGPILRGETEPRPPAAQRKGGEPPPSNGHGPQPGPPVPPSTKPNGRPGPKPKREPKREPKPEGPKTKDQVEGERQLRELRAERNLIELKLTRNRRRDTGSPRPLSPKRVRRAKATNAQLTVSLQARGVGVPDEGPIDVAATMKTLTQRKRADATVQQELTRLAAAREVLGRLAREADEQGTVKVGREQGPMPLREQRRLETRRKQIDDELERRGQPSEQRQQERIDRRGEDSDERMAIPAQATRGGEPKLGHTPAEKAAAERVQRLRGEERKLKAEHATVGDKLSQVRELEQQARNRGDQELVAAVVAKRKQLEQRERAVKRALGQTERKRRRAEREHAAVVGERGAAEERGKARTLKRKQAETPKELKARVERDFDELDAALQRGERLEEGAAIEALGAATKAERSELIELAETYNRLKEREAALYAEVRGTPVNMRDPRWRELSDLEDASAAAREKYDALRERVLARSRGGGPERRGGHQNGKNERGLATVPETPKTRETRPERWDDVGAFLKTPFERNDPDRTVGLATARSGFTGESLFELELTKNHVLKSLGHQERRIGLRRLGEQMLRLAANRAPLDDPAMAAELAAALERRGGIRYSVHREGENAFYVLPEAVLDSWRRQVADHGPAASAGRWITRQFLGAALPLSITWHAGNTIDLTTRLALAGGLDPRNRAAFEHLRRAMHQLDPEQADAILAAVKGHTGSRQLVLDPPRLKDIAERLDGVAGKVLGPALRGGSAARQLPLVRVAPNAGAKVRDFAWDLGSGAEAQLVRQAAGKAMRDLADTMGYELRSHAQLGQAMARDLLRDPDLVSEFHRRTVEIVGDYRKLWRQRRFANLLDFTFPFASWMKEAIRFTLVTVPSKHPLRLALMAEIAAMTERQRREIGASRYVTDADVQRLNEQRPADDPLPPPSQGFLAGALKGRPDEGGIAMVPLTSFGEVAGLIQNPLEYALTKPFPWAQKPAGVAAGSSARGGVEAARAIRRKQRYPNHLRGLERAEASAFWAFESLVPMIRQIHQVRRGGGIPRASSSALRPRPVPGTRVPLRQNRVVNPLAPSAPEPASKRRRLRRKTRDSGPAVPPPLGF